MPTFVEIYIFLTKDCMGVYLSEPNTEKEIKEGSGSGIIYCKA